MRKFFAYCKKCDIAIVAKDASPVKCADCNEDMQIKSTVESKSFKFEIKAKHER